jgi:thiol-disulfide isomerase/thioredoxin
VRKARPTLRSAVLLLTLCALSLTSCDRGGHPARIGAPAPVFTLADGARNVDLARLRGHIVVLHFWATWCAPCVVEMPSLVALQRRRPQVTVLAISQDEDPDLLTLRDPSARIPRLYGTIKIPETYIIDSRGILRRKFVSAQDWTSPEVLDYLSKL